MMQDEGLLLKGIVEMDETYIGGKPHKEAKKNDDDDNDKPSINKRGRGTKKAVVGMIERKGNVKAKAAYEFKSYSRMKSLIEHKQVDHSSTSVTDKEKITY